MQAASADQNLVRRVASPDCGVYTTIFPLFMKGRAPFELARGRARTLLQDLDGASPGARPLTPQSAAAPAQSHVDAHERRRRIFAIAMMCATMVCFTGHDATGKWLASSLPTIEIVWARYIFAAVFGLVVLRPIKRPKLLISRRPALQVLRSLMLLGSTVGNFLALRQMQLAETATISFLWPMFVALLAGPLLGEWAGPARMAAIGLGLIGVMISFAPGLGAFHPVAFAALAGVLCNAFYSLLTRVLAAHDRPETTLAWTPLVGVALLTPALPFVWVAPPTPAIAFGLVMMGLFATAGHGLLILAHQRAPAPVLAPFAYTQLIWMTLAGLLVFGDRPRAATLLGAAIVIGCGLFLISRERAAPTRR
jgi:drug/metabolite transporter (DMT)-like permease